MATAVLTIAGSYFGPWGAYIGAMIGGYIDQNYLFKPDPIEGPRLTDLSVTISSYGTSIPLVYGAENRVSGNIIWTTGLLETATKRKAGGKGGGGTTVKEYSYRASLAIALGEGPMTNLSRIWADGKLLLDLTVNSPPTKVEGSPGNFWLVTQESIVADLGFFAPFVTLTHPSAVSEVYFYRGSFDHVPNPVMESYLGVGNTPAYRGTCYVVLKDLQLADYGNRIPNLEFEINGLAPRNVDSVLQDISERAGLSQGEFSVGSAPNDTIRGYSVANAGNALAAIEPLTGAFFFDVVDANGTIKFKSRGTGPQASIETQEFGARPSKDGFKTPIEWTRRPEVEMPRSVAVTYLEAARDYNEGTQYAEHLQGDAASEVSLPLPITLTAGEARTIADAVLWSQWAGRTGAKFSVNDRHGYLQPGELIHATISGEPLLLRLTNVTRGADGVIECDATLDDPTIYQSTAAGESASVPALDIPLASETILYLLNIPLLPTTADDDGYYFAVDSAGDGWRGAELNRSIDSGTTYTDFATVGIRSITGAVSGTLASGPTTVWDRANTLTVTLNQDDHELSSLDENLILNGSNGAYIGKADGTDGEIVQFATATLVSAGVYTISNLLRGRLGTEANASTHTTGEVFVLIEKDILNSVDFSASDWDASRLFKPVSILTSIDDTDSQSFTNTGEKKRPYSPVHGAGTRDASDNLTITWMRRTRLTVPSVAGPAPLGEESESYEIDVYSGSTVVRTLTSTTQSVAYTAAQQSTDGLTPGNPVSIRIYQMSASRGRGHPGIFTV